MKHLFWIICGVLALGLLIAWLIVVPADETRAAKKKLDQQSAQLLNLGVRAARTPDGVFDLEKPEDISHLQNDYLATPNWKIALQPHQEKYQGQLDQIQKQLLSRSEFLGRKVAESTDVLAWYRAYLKSSEALLKRLKDAGCLRQAATTGETVATSNDESPAELRRAAGLYTKSSDYPESKEHPLITAQLHAMELVADRLITARIAIADNPTTGPTGRPDDRAAANAVLISAGFEAPVGGSAFGHPVGTVISDLVGTQAMGLKLVLEGPLSALYAAIAALDSNAQADRPLIAIGAATLSRRSEFTAGERDDAAAEPARLELSLSIIYFSDQQLAAVPGGNAQGPGGMSDMPPPAPSHMPFPPGGPPKRSGGSNP